MKKNKIIIVITIVLVFAILGFLTWKFWLSESKKEGNELSKRQTDLANLADERMAKEKNEEEKIVINLPKSGEKINSPLNIAGQINGDGWSGFEGQAGTVELQDEKGNVLGSAVLVPISDWMKLPTKFKATLDFSSSKQQKGKLIFKNENPSGMSENDRKFVLDVQL